MSLKNWQRAKLKAVRCCFILCVLSVLTTFSHSQLAFAATVPSGFTDSLVANGLSNPTAMELAPDGRIFVCEQGGTLRIIKNGALLATPFLSVTVNSSGERGLLGVTFDPNFASNQFVYVYYTATTPTIHNRISRFTASGDLAVAGSETVIFELDNLSSATNHNGGAIHFGPDGHLYAAVGENANGSNAQSLMTVLGKILRITANGTIPSDNPFFSSTSGNNRAIWALGLRNPFTFAFQPGSGRLFINDVGENTFEEINEGLRGANYGWPICEGTCNSGFENPLYTYIHDGSVCAIAGGAFYNPQTIQFPSSYLGNYFFADLCGGWIQRLDPANGNAVSGFATGISNPVDLKVSTDGSLYYLARGIGAVGRIAFPGTVDSIPPTVSITNPTQGSIVTRKATITISATANDNVGVARVEFYVNGGLRCTDSSASYNCSWKVPSQPNRSYQIQARAFDLAGNVATSVVQVTSR